MPPQNHLDRVTPGSDSGPENSSIASDLKEFGESLFVSAVQNPVNGLSQLASAVTEPITGEKLPELNLVHPDKPTTEGGRLSQQVGTALGLILPFMLARSAVGVTTEKFGLQASSSIGAAAAEQGATGALMGLALTPSDPNQNFWMSRLKSGAIDAGTFAAMGAAGAGLNSISSFGLQDASLARRVFTTAAVGAGSGLPGGFVNAELSSLLNGKGAASLGDVGNNMAGFAAFGGLMGGVGALRGGETGGGSASDSQIKAGEPAARATDSNLADNKRVEVPTRHAAEVEADIARRFAPYTDEQLATGRQAVVSELSQMKASAENGQSMSVLEKLQRSNLSDAQKERILSAMSAVRENHVSFIEDGKLNPDQEKNWIHTQGEFGRVLDSAREMKMTPEQTEDALLGSMFSDAVKTPA
ncbi:MAG TPA: hypothetical protein V6C72_06590, partial [Chroococcales cyanobacterium]